MPRARSTWEQHRSSETAEVFLQRELQLGICVGSLDNCKQSIELTSKAFALIDVCAMLTLLESIGMSRLQMRLHVKRWQKRRQKL